MNATSKLCCILNPDGICSICDDQVCKDCMPLDWHRRPVINDGETFRWCPKSPELLIHWGDDNVTLVIGKPGSR